MRYSKKTGSFYPEWGKYDDLPDDLITIPDSDHDLVMGRGLKQKFEVVDGRVVIEDLPGSTLAEMKSALQAANKSACSKHILSEYPIEVQSSALLGVYPKAKKAAIAVFIATCVTEENRVFSLIDSVTSIEQLQSVEKPVWP